MYPQHRSIYKHRTVIINGYITLRLILFIILEYIRIAFEKKTRLCLISV